MPEPGEFVISSNGGPPVSLKQFVIDGLWAIQERMREADEAIKMNQATPENEPPRRRFYFHMKAHSDELFMILQILREAVEDIERGLQASGGGGFTSGHNWKLDVDDTITHESYQCALAQYIKRNRLP